MNARIGHVTDVRDTRPVFEIMYRRYSDTRTSFLRVQVGSVEEAMRALTEHIGNTHYTVTSVRAVECPKCGQEQHNCTCV